MVGGFRQFGGDVVAELARRAYSGTSVSDDEWSRVFAVFGPHVPDRKQLARRIRNLRVAECGFQHMYRLDLTEQLSRITGPTLICVGQLDGVMPVDASREIAAGLRPGCRAAGGD